MQTPKLLSIDQAAQILGMTPQQVLDLCKKREIVAQFLENTGSWMITQRAVVAYLSRTRQWQAIKKTLTYRALVIDGDSRAQSLIQTAFGRKSPVEVRLCTKPEEVAGAIRTFLPDCVCIRILRPRPDKDPFVESVIQATRERPVKVILFHNIPTPQLQAMEALNQQIQLLHVEFLINITPGVQPLLEAIKVELGTV
jgi:hypothetical protein